MSADAKGMSGGNNKIVIHPSSLPIFFDCPYKWYRDHIYKPIRTIGIAAHAGTGIHKAAEIYYKESISEQAWAKPRDDFKGVAIDCLRDKIKDESPTDLKEVNLNELEKSVGDCALNYTKNARSLCKDTLPIASERAYEVKIKSPIIESVKGTLDIVGEDYIGDIKTMSRANNPTKYAIQQGVYGVLREQKGESVGDFIIHRVVLPKQTIDSVSILQSFDNPFTPASALIEKSKFYLNAIINTCNEFDKTGNELLFRGNPQCLLCSAKYCAYFFECKWRKC